MATQATRMAEAPEVHPPVARLLAFYHRTLESVDARRLLIHLHQCGACRGKLRRIEAAVTLFRGTPAFRQDCPSAPTLFQFAGSELHDEQMRAMNEHIHICYACRDEVLVFRDVRHAARSGHSAFLDPLNWRLRQAYWKRRGYRRWLFQPRWRKRSRRVLMTGVALLAVGAIWQGIQVEFDRRPRNRSYQSTAAYAPVEEAPSVPPTQEGPAFQVPTGPRQRYFFQYLEGRPLSQLPPTHDEARWATTQIDASRQDPRAFRIGEPLQTEGLLILRPRSPLTAPQQEAVQARLEQALAGPAREDARAWSAVRAELQRSTGGEVWLMNRPGAVRARQQEEERQRAGLEGKEDAPSAQGSGVSR